MYLYEACMNISEDNFDAIKHTIQDMFDELDNKETLSDKNEETKDSLEELIDILDSKDFEWFKTMVKFHQSGYGGMKRKKLYDQSEEYKVPLEYYMTLKQNMDLLSHIIWLEVFRKDIEDKLSSDELEEIGNKIQEIRELITTINNQTQ